MSVFRKLKNLIRSGQLVRMPQARIAQGSNQMATQQSIKRVNQGTIQKAPSVNSSVIRGTLRKAGRSILG